MSERRRSESSGTQIITHPEKVLFPDDGITKGELVDYYRRIAPWMLPHLRDRPIALERYPSGIGTPGFFQKATPAYYPDWIRRVMVPKRDGGAVRQVVCDDAATLVYLANQGCVTPHIFLSRADRLDYPDRMLFDLDPGDGGFEPARAAAQALRVLLDELGLPAFLKTTGSRGLHVSVPLQRREGFDTVRAFARAIASEIVSRDPEQWTVEQRKAPRRGRLFVDTNRNAYAQLIAPAYAVRARRGAPVAVPLRWDELGRADLRSNGVTIRTAFDRIASVGDPWADFRQSAASLARARQRFERAARPRG